MVLAKNNINIIEADDRLFHLKRIFKENSINFEKGTAEDLKTAFHCDTLFKKEGMLYLCSEIKEINYEEPKENQPSGSGN